MGEKKGYTGLQAKNECKGNDVILRRAFEILRYLKHNTDKDHPTTQTEMRGAIDNVGSKGSFIKMMKCMAKTLNFDEYEILRKEVDRRLLFSGFEKMHEHKEFKEGGSFSLKDIYYNHPFSQDEVRKIVTAIKTSTIILPDEQDDLIKKVKSELASKHFKDTSDAIYTKEQVFSESFGTNLIKVQEAISEGRQITFNMNYYDGKNQYDGKNKLLKYRESLKISPCFIMVDSGKYFVAGCFENNDKKNLAIIRIDLMSKIEMTEESATRLYDIPELQNASKEYNKISEKDFRTLHLDMSYDSPITVEMKVRKTAKTNNSVNYTPIHDAFGDNYTVVEKCNGYDIVRVRCSRYGIVNWALSHDEVEIISPYDVVDEITERVCKLNEKYNNYNYMYSESLERLDKFIKEHKDIDFKEWHKENYIDPDNYSVRVRNKILCTADGLISINRMYGKYNATSELVKEYKEYRKTPILYFPSEYNGINSTRARVFGDRPDHTLYDLKMYFEGSKDCRLGSAYKLPLTSEWLGSFKNFSDLTEWLGIKGIFVDENNEVFDLEYNDGTIIKGYAEKYDWKWSDAYYNNLKEKIKEYEKMH